MLNTNISSYYTVYIIAVMLSSEYEHLRDRIRSLDLARRCIDIMSKRV